MWGGSRPGKAKNKDRKFAEAHQRLLENNFSGVNSKYNENDFEHHFCMPRICFDGIGEEVLGDC